MRWHSFDRTAKMLASRLEVISTFSTWISDRCFRLHLSVRRFCLRVSRDQSAKYLTPKYLTYHADKSFEILIASIRWRYRFSAWRRSEIALHKHRWTSFHQLWREDSLLSHISAVFMSVKNALRAVIDTASGKNLVSTGSIQVNLNIFYTEWLLILRIVLENAKIVDIDDIFVNWVSDRWRFNETAAILLLYYWEGYERPHLSSDAHLKPFCTMSTPVY